MKPSQNHSFIPPQPDAEERRNSAVELRILLAALFGMCLLVGFAVSTSLSNARDIVESEATSTVEPSE